MKDLVEIEQNRRGRHPQFVPYRNYLIAVRQIEKLNERIAALENENTLLSLIGPSVQRVRLRRFGR